MDLAKNSNVTVLISSHKLDEVSRIATNIGIIHDGKLIKEIDGKELESQLKKSLIIDGKDIIAIKSILSKAGYKIDLRDKSLTEEFLALQIQNEYVVNNPDKIATLLANAGHPPTLLKVEKEDLEMYFLRAIKEIGGDLK